MKRFVPPLFTFFATFAAQAAQWVAMPQWQRHFDAKGMKGTFVLFEPCANRWQVLDEARARQRFLPASTFKIPNALIGLEAGSIRDENEVFKWDGRPKPRTAWERDHTLESGMKESVVWMFQEVARRTGRARMRGWLERFDYGNRDIAGGIDLFWLQGALRISAVEQVEFLRRLEEGRLTVSPRSRRLVREAILVERTSAYTLRAKTGTADRSNGAVGWWVGWVERRGRVVAYFAMNFTPAPGTKYEDRFTVSRAILVEAGVLPSAGARQ
jgi:beta-lactamase class D